MPDETGVPARDGGPGHDERSMLAGVASTIAGVAAGAASPVIEAVEQLASGARRRFGERSGARVRGVRRLARQPLPNLWEVHPEARRASFRELEPRVVPVAQIVGTAVEGPAQRGGDFLPIRQLRGEDWRARWQRLLRGIDELVNLPPVDLIKFGEDYWVVDGHNRVAAALYTGQVGLDANVLEARLPGLAVDPPGAGIAPYLETSRELRDAGAGRLTRTAGRRELVRPAEATASDASEEAGGDGLPTPEPRQDG
ncbi:MAG: hypothetical protein M3N29_00625 [Chloroflexota bacterium]|nr:hypothetical protein [Chloroflexota bacterium]